MYTKNIIIETGIKFTYTKSIDDKKKTCTELRKMNQKPVN